MKKYTSFEKLSKKKQMELNRQKRGSWGVVNPVTRKSADAKIYNRKKARKRSDEGFDTVLFDCSLSPFAAAVRYD